MKEEKKRETKKKVKRQQASHPSPLTSSYTRNLSEVKGRRWERKKGGGAICCIPLMLRGETQGKRVRKKKEEKRKMKELSAAGATRFG